MTRISMLVGGYVATMCRLTLGRGMEPTLAGLFYFERSLSKWVAEMTATGAYSCQSGIGSPTEQDLGDDKKSSTKFACFKSGPTGTAYLKTYAEWPT